MFYFDKVNEKSILKSDVVDNLDFFFTTRETVIKSQEFSLKNKVEHNKRDICNFLKINNENLIAPIQTHSDNVDIAQIGKCFYPDTDALILSNNKQAIFLNFADCTPVILYDNLKNIAAVVHAGWRGTAKSIVVKTVKKMEKEFCCLPQNIFAIVGPAISLCCYDVGEEVYEQLKLTVQNFDDLFEIRNKKFFVDLKAINARQLREIGVDNIDICPYCTVCNNDKFFSYRKENATTSRHSALIKLR